MLSLLVKSNTSKMTTLNLCTFCFKSILIEDSQNKNNNTVQKFIKLLNRFVDDKDDKKFVRLTLSLPSSLLNCCEDCEHLVSTFCKVYHGIKCLELKLLHKLDMLVKVMQSAEKVTSRVQLLQQCFQSDLNNDEVNSCSSDKENLKTLRTGIMKNCNKTNQNIK